MSSPVAEEILATSDCWRERQFSLSVAPDRLLCSSGGPTSVHKLIGCYVSVVGCTSMHILGVFNRLSMF